MFADTDNGYIFTTTRGVVLDFYIAPTSSTLGQVQLIDTVSRDDLVELAAALFQLAASLEGEPVAQA